MGVPLCRSFPSLPLCRRCEQRVKHGDGERQKKQQRGNDAGVVEHGGGDCSQNRGGQDDAIDSPVLSDGAATYRQAVGLVGEVRGGAKSYYSADSLGSTRAQTNASGNVSAMKETDAFGNVWLPGTVGVSASPFGFAGQHGYQIDNDSGLQLLGYRYYDPSTGRFLSRDPIQDGNNWYTYCNNDSVNAIDPEGLKPPYIPVAPPHANLRDNVVLAEGVGQPGRSKGFIDALYVYVWFNDMVKYGGPWDYKTSGPQYEEFGNFNYGVVGAASGLNLDVLLVAAGIAQMNHKDQGSPQFGADSNHDDPHDQFWIKEGYEYYFDVLRKK